MPHEHSCKYKERILLSQIINSEGVEIMKCSSCERHHRTCVVLNEKSKRCDECVHRGVSCDVGGVPLGSLAALRREEERLKFERDQAFSAAMEGLARVQRLEKQQALLKKRGNEMIRRGLQSLDELDAAEESERLTAERAERDALQPIVVVSEVDPLSDLDPSPSDPFWAEIGLAQLAPTPAPQDTGRISSTDQGS